MLQKNLRPLQGQSVFRAIQLYSFSFFKNLIIYTVHRRWNQKCDFLWLTLPHSHSIAHVMHLQRLTHGNHIQQQLIFYGHLLHCYRQLALYGMLICQPIIFQHPLQDFFSACDLILQPLSYSLISEFPVGYHRNFKFPNLQNWVYLYIQSECDAIMMGRAAFEYLDI